MAASKNTQASVQDFDARLSQLKKDLIEFWDDETSPVTAPALDALADLWADVPELDSKAVQRASRIIERHLGFKLTAKFLKRGGFDTCDEFLDDLLPKLRDACAGKELGNTPPPTIQNTVHLRNTER